MHRGIWYLVQYLYLKVIGCNLLRYDCGTILIMAHIQKGVSNVTVWHVSTKTLTTSAPGILLQSVKTAPSLTALNADLMEGIYPILLDYSCYLLSLLLLA